MLCFDVTLNDNRRVVAGSTDKIVRLDVTLGPDQGPVRLSLAGLPLGAADVYSDWLRVELQVGDEVRLKVVEAEPSAAQLTTSDPSATEGEAELVCAVCAKDYTEVSNFVRLERLVICDDCIDVLCRMKNS